MHTWLNTQAEGWWRMEFDRLKIPYDYISTQNVAKIADLRAKYDVIVFGPGGGRGNAQSVDQRHADVRQSAAVEGHAADAESGAYRRDRRHAAGDWAGSGWSICRNSCARAAC